MLYKPLEEKFRNVAKVGKGLLDFLLLDDLNTLADKDASGLDKGIALASFIPIGKALKIPKAIDKIVDSNVDEVVKKSNVDEVVGKGTGKETYQHLKDYKNNKYSTRSIEYRLYTSIRFRWSRKK